MVTEYKIYHYTYSEEGGVRMTKQQAELMVRTSYNNKGYEYTLGFIEGLFIAHTFDALMLDNCLECLEDYKVSK